MATFTHAGDVVDTDARRRWAGDDQIGFRADTACGRTVRPVHLTRPDPVDTGPSRSRGHRAVLDAAGLASLVFAVVAAVWLAVPTTNAFADTASLFSSDRTLLSGELSPEAAAATMLVTSALGVLVASWDCWSALVGIGVLPRRWASSVSPMPCSSVSVSSTRRRSRLPRT
jgi:hypothetical protein